MIFQNTVIQAEAMCVSNLFQRGTFEVPWHQRYYDWTIDDVEALIDDIGDAVDENRNCYFLGSIILIDVNENHWLINDGQQRMVTISLIVASLCRRFVMVGKGSQREGLALRILFDLDSNQFCSIDKVDHYRPRITPPKSDEVQYKQMIRGYSIGANGKLSGAWNAIERYFASMEIEKLEQFFDFILGKLEIACLRVPVGVDPNAVYETINCRGKPLDQLDQIRNYFYSEFNSNSDIERRTTVHENLERIRVVFSQQAKAAEYIRCFFQTRFGFLHKDKIYREVRKKIKGINIKPRDTRNSSSAYAFNLVQDLSSFENLELFRTMNLSNFDAEFIQRFKIDSNTTRSTRNLSVVLRELRAYKVTQPLVFSILQHYLCERDGRRRKRIARVANKYLCSLAAFVLRTAFVAPKFEPSQFEAEFSNYSVRITDSVDLVDLEFLNFLINCDRSSFGVANDQVFRDLLSNAKMTGDVKIKLFLLGINSRLQSDSILLNDRLCTVEHVLSKSKEHQKTWEGFEDVDEADWTNRIGNMTLLGPADNKPGRKFNGKFEAKKNIYRNSSVTLTRNLCDVKEWTPTEILSRQSMMVEHAVQVWKIV